MWSSPWRQDQTRPDEPPARADVVVVGGGLAGLSAAAALAEGGASVALFEARRRLYSGASDRAGGLVTAGLLDPPHRLIASLGEAASREVMAFSLENARQIRALGVGRFGGVVAAAMGDREAAEVEARARAARRLGVEVELWSAARVNQHLGARGFGPGVFCPGDGAVDPAALCAARARGGTGKR